MKSIVTKEHYKSMYEFSALDLITNPLLSLACDGSGEHAINRRAGVSFHVHCLTTYQTTMRSLSLIAAAAAVAAPSATAFSTSAFMGSRMAATAPASSSALSMRVVDIDSPDAFDKTIESAGGALVVVDYSTTWCGPCKVIAPKFDELSDQYPDAVFLKVSLVQLVARSLRFFWMSASVSSPPPKMLPLQYALDT